MKKYIDVIEKIEVSIKQLDGHLAKFKKVIVVDLDGDTTQSEFSLDIKDLIRAAVVNQLETPHGLIGDQFKNYLNEDLKDVTLTIDKDRLLFHVERHSNKDESL